MTARHLAAADADAETTDPNDPAAMLLRELMDAETSPSEETPMCYTCGSHDHEQKQCPESWRVIEGIEDGAVEKEDAKEDGKEENLNSFKKKVKKTFLFRSITSKEKTKKQRRKRNER